MESSTLALNSHNCTLKQKKLCTAVYDASLTTAHVVDAVHAPQVQVSVRQEPLALPVRRQVLDEHAESEY